MKDAATPKEAEGAVRIAVNGVERQIEGETNVTQLLAALGLEAGVLVEVNGRALFPKEWRETILAAGDKVEIIRVVAGG